VKATHEDRSVMGRPSAMRDLAIGQTRVTNVAPSTVAALTRRPGAAERSPAGHQRRRRALEITLGIAVPFSLILLWQAASTRGWIDERFYPRPTNIVRKGWEEWQEGLLWDAVWNTTKLSLIGFAWGVAGGLLFGVLMGTSRTIRAALEPMLNALYTVPKISLLGIMIAIFGLGSGNKIALIATTVFFFVWIATQAAIMSVPEGYREAAQSFGAGRWQRFRHVLLPAALPQIFVGLRMSAGVTVLVLVSAEGILSSTQSETVGGMIFNSRLSAQYPRMYVGIVLSALLGVVFVFAVRMVGRLCTPWAPEDRSIAAR
jgi:sulfonate transport system permease protein